MINANLKSVFHNLKILKQYPLRAIGLSNGCYDYNQKKLPDIEHGILFYELDTLKDIEKYEAFILKFFKNDCIRLKTKRGFHYVSFIISKQYEALHITQKLTHQYIKNLDISDYGRTTENCLILRITPKMHWFSKREYSPKPVFDKILRKPNQNKKYSFSHIRIYMMRGILPKSIYKIYPLYNLKECSLRYTAYQTSNYNKEKMI